MPGTKTAQELFKELNSELNKVKQYKKKKLVIKFFEREENALGDDLLDGCTSLIDIAIKANCPAFVVDKLIDHIGKIDFGFLYLGKSVLMQPGASLHLAVNSGNADVVCDLLARMEPLSPDLNKENKEGSTALDYAKPDSQMYALLESHGAAHSEKYQHLTSLGIKVEDFDEEKLKIGGTYCFSILEKALNIEDSENREKVVTWLVKSKGANVNCVFAGQILLEKLASDWKNLDNQLPKLELLLKLGATPVHDKFLKNIFNHQNVYRPLSELIIKYLNDDQGLIAIKLLASDDESNLEVAKVFSEKIAKDKAKKSELKSVIDNFGIKTLLQRALEAKDYDLAELLIKNGAREGIEKALWRFFERNDVNDYSKEICLLLKYYDTIGANSLLLKIIETKNINSIKDLIKNNANIIELEDSNGDTLLSLAIKNNCDDKILKELLQSGADPYSVNNGGLTALGLLAQNKGSNLEQVKILVEAMEKMACRDASKRSALKSIIETKSKEIQTESKTLNEIQIESKTLLERALVDDKDDIAGLLIIAGARKGINIKDDQGKDIFDRSFNNNPVSELWHGNVFINPLIDRAIGEKDLFIIRKLLNHERTKNLIIEKVRCNDDLVTKMIKDKFDSNNQFLEFLINNNLLSANAKIHGKPLLQLACEADNLSAAKLLINLGADISAKIAHGYTSLDYVLEKEEFFTLFIDTINGYEKSKKVELLSSAMLHAVQSSKKEVSDKWFQLLQYGASVTYQNSDGDNLMHLVQQVLPYDASVTYQNSDGDNPMRLAQQVSRGELVLDVLLQNQLPHATCKGLVLALSTKNNEGKTPIDGINHKSRLAPYTNYFDEYKVRKSREVLYKGLGATALTTLLVGAFACLFFAELPVALYASAAVVLIGIACTAYKVYSVGKSVNEETRDVHKSIDSRLNELSASGRLNVQISGP